MNAIPEILLEYMQGLKTHDVALIARTVAPDLRVVLPSRTLAKPDFLGFLTAIYAAFPDWDYRHDEPEARGADHFAVKWYQSGTHRETLALPGRASVAPTGKPIRIPEQFFFYQIAGNQIVEIRPDAIPGGAPWGILEQLGMPAL